VTSASTTQATAPATLIALPAIRIGVFSKADVHMVRPARHRRGQETKVRIGERNRGPSTVAVDPGNACDAILTTALTPSGILGIRPDSLRHFGASGIEEARFPRSSVTDPISLNP
jgi:hypothetical protein